MTRSPTSRAAWERADRTYYADGRQFDDRSTTGEPLANDDVVDAKFDDDDKKPAKDEDENAKKESSEEDDA